MGRLADMLAVARILHHAYPAEDLLLAKSDFRAAYPGCPILEDHLIFSDILVRDPRSGRVWASTQLAMPFGAVAAVYAWDRLGGALTFLLQQILLLPTARYVDDLFWVDFSGCAEDTSGMALELVSLLGLTLEPGKTPPPASCLDVLGVSVSLRRHPTSGHYEARLLPEPLKVAVWCQQISDALVSDSVTIHEVEQLAGRLELSCYSVWGPAARSRLRSLYELVSAGGGRLTTKVREDLRWWLGKLRVLPPSSIPLTLREPPLSSCTPTPKVGAASAASLSHSTPASGRPVQYRPTWSHSFILARPKSTLWSSSRCWRLSNSFPPPHGAPESSSF